MAQRLSTSLGTKPAARNKSAAPLVKSARGRSAFPEPAKGSVPAVQRAIKVLETLAATPAALSLAELTTQLQLPKSSVLGICSTLVEGGLLQRSSSGAYRLGMRIVDLAHTYLAQSNVTTQFVEAWKSMKVLPEETVVLAVLDGTDVTYVGCRNGGHGLTFHYRIGMRLPATCTASGKALLSTLPDSAITDLFRRQTLPRLTAKSLQSVEELRRELATIRARGYATDKEETREGMCCIGAPIFDAPGGSAVAAVAVSMLKAEFATEKKKRMIDNLRLFAATLSSRLGG